MGQCLGRQRRYNENPEAPHMKTQPLRTEFAKWKSPVPITMGQCRLALLRGGWTKSSSSDSSATPSFSGAASAGNGTRTAKGGRSPATSLSMMSIKDNPSVFVTSLSAEAAPENEGVAEESDDDDFLVGKRDEFWETAPNYEGKKEIWDALRAAAAAAESNDFVLAQAILDGAGIYIPNGSLQDAYDELGNSYKVPIYCLSRPANLLVEEFDGDFTKEPIQVVSDDPLDEELFYIKVRLSTMQQDETELSLRGGDTIVNAKMKLAQQISNSSRQRWFYSGQLLEDRLRIRDLNIPHGHIVQVVLSDLISAAPAANANANANNTAHSKSKEQ